MAGRFRKKVDLHSLWNPLSAFCHSGPRIWGFLIIYNFFYSLHSAIFLPNLHRPVDHYNYIRSRMWDLLVWTVKRCCFVVPRRTATDTSREE